ncbi:MAG TPA: inositol monophosphatase family protein [Microthrixaceae bacterium]|nr:inositol monophosphatase family protein [Microthrixaceae bacterium]HRW40353.1 inositol monophosphatase family protein [Microthrixaceae bacterium]
MTEPNASTAIPPVDEKLLEQAVAWTRAAGELTLGWFNHPELGVEHKHDGSPVTAADRAAERLLREEIAAALPDDTVRGEEEGDRVGTSGRTWVIDPIDGTLAFSRGVGTYSNLLYMEDEHGPAIGVINLPALGETVWAGRGRGCFLDGARCSVSDRAELSGSYLSVTGFHEWTPDMFDRVTGSGLQLRTWGDAYGYALVASGRVEAMFDPALAWWDLAAMLVVIPEAGGTLTSWSGGDPAVENIDHPEYRWSAIASNGAFHDRLVEVLAR